MIIEEYRKILDRVMPRAVNADDLFREEGIEVLPHDSRERTTVALLLLCVKEIKNLKDRVRDLEHK